MTATAKPPKQPANDLDRRGALRHAVDIVGHVIGPGIDSIAVSLTDVSEQGCRIAQSDWLGDASLVTITLDGFASFDCTVAWTSSDATGLRFDEKLHPAVIRQIVAMGQGRKRPPRLLDAGIVRRDEADRRWRVSRDVLVDRHAAGPRPERLAARLFDLSSAGCRIDSDARLAPGGDVTVWIDGLDPVAATVSWSDKMAAGLTFAVPIAVGVVERIANERHVARRAY
jgi:hypothetical protein